MLEAARLDLRGLEPPQPLIQSLEATRDLEDGGELVILTDRRPVHLLSLLLERGFQIDAVPLGDHHETFVKKPAVLEAACVPSPRT